MVSRRASTPGATARMDALLFLMSIVKYTMAERNGGRYSLRMQTTNVNSASVAVFADHKDAENAIKALQHGGFDFHKLSIVGADYHSDEDVVGYYNNGDRMLAWGRNGAFWASGACSSEPLSSSFQALDRSSLPVRWWQPSSERSKALRSSEPFPLPARD
jgi:hypothetical protein